MQTHQDIWFSEADELEHVYFRAYRDPYPILDFIPWPIRVPGIVFPDGSEMFTAGGGGGIPSFVAGPGISISYGVGTITISNTAPQTPWLSNINANGFSITNLNSINGVPVSQMVQSPWQSDILGNGYSLVDVFNINATGSIYSGGGISAPNGSVTGDTLISSGNVLAGGYIEANGNIISFGCFYIGTVEFACSNGAGGIDLTNISTINGAAPGGGSELWQLGAGGSIYYNEGPVGIGTAAPNAVLQVNGEIRTTNRTPTTPGSPVRGVELGYDSSSTFGGIENYNYGTGLYEPIYVNGSIVLLNNPGNQAPAPGYVGINTGNPQFTLDVNGVINTSSCYYSAGVPFACSNGAGEIALTNIATINGAPPGGGGGAAQTPWLSNIDGGGFSLSDVGLVNAGGYQYDGRTLGLWFQSTSPAGIYCQGTAVSINALPSVYTLYVNGDLNISGSYFQGGSPVAFMSVAELEQMRSRLRSIESRMGM